MEEDFSPFNPARYRELAEVPDEQRAYFVRMKEQGQPPLLWARVPHVFYQGEIDVKTAEIVQW